MKISEMGFQDTNHHMEKEEWVNEKLHEGVYTLRRVLLDPLQPLAGEHAV
jgi:hypothetical protein